MSRNASSPSVRRKLARVASTAVAMVAVNALTMHGASAAPVVSDPIVEGLAGPLQFAVAPDGAIYVAQSFGITLTKVVKNGDDVTLTDVASEPNGEIAGVTAQPFGRVTFVSTVYSASGGMTAEATYLKRIEQNGDITTVANLLEYEQTRNPDESQSYGFQGLDEECAEQVPEELGGGFPHPGGIDSHPYAVAAVASARIVADAGGNTLLKVGPKGRVTTLAVLPPQPVVIEEHHAEHLGLPECTIGATYNFEAVPTDVELGPDGRLYVTTLPGGPEDDSLGARGSVSRVNAESGSLRRIATGFVGATNVAVSPEGKIFVAELFGSRVSRAFRGGAVNVVDTLLQPAALEWAKGKLYVSYNAFTNGSIATITL